MTECRCEAWPQSARAKGLRSWPLRSCILYMKRSGGQQQPQPASRHSCHAASRRAGFALDRCCGWCMKNQCGHVLCQGRSPHMNPFCLASTHQKAPPSNSSSGVSCRCHGSTHETSSPAAAPVSSTTATVDTTPAICSDMGETSTNSERAYPPEQRAWSGRHLAHGPIRNLPDGAASAAGEHWART